MGGRFDTEVDFDPGSGIKNITPIGYQDGFVLKLDKNGKFVWVQDFQSQKDEHAHVSNLAVSPNGDVWICGAFEATVDLNPGAGVDNHTSLGNLDDFAVLLDTNGNYMWGKSWGDASTSYKDDCSAIAIDAVGNCYITGSFGIQPISIRALARRI